MDSRPFVHRVRRISHMLLTFLLTNTQRHNLLNNDDLMCAPYNLGGLDCCHSYVVRIKNCLPAFFSAYAEVLIVRAF